jgi:hypothetical protein
MDQLYFSFEIKFATPSCTGIKADSFVAVVLGAFLPPLPPVGTAPQSEERVRESIACEKTT